MINTFQSEAKRVYLLKDKNIFKEFIKIPQKFEVPPKFDSDFSIEQLPNQGPLKNWRCPS